MNNPQFKFENLFPVYEDSLYTILSKHDLSYCVHASDLAHIGLNMLFFGLKEKTPEDRKEILDGLMDKILDIKNSSHDITTPQCPAVPKTAPRKPNL